MVCSHCFRHQSQPPAATYNVTLYYHHHCRRGHVVIPIGVMCHYFGMRLRVGALLQNTFLNSKMFNAETHTNALINVK